MISLKPKRTNMLMHIRLLLIAPLLCSGYSGLSQSPEALRAWERITSFYPSGSMLYVVSAGSESGLTQALELPNAADGLDFVFFNLCASNNFINQQLQFSGLLTFESWDAKSNEFRFSCVDFGPLQSLTISDNGGSARWDVDTEDWTAEFLQPWPEHERIVLQRKEYLDWPYCGAAPPRWEVQWDR